MTTPVSSDVTLNWEDHPAFEPVSRGVILLWSDLLADATQFALNDGFMFDLDEALKTKLRGIYVDDAETESTGKKREAKVFFRWPLFEVTDQTFPFITIELLRFSPAHDREQRAEGLLIPYTPKGYPPPVDGQPFLYTEQAPIPYDFVHQVTVHSRFNSHDRQISTQMLLPERLPPRGAYMVVGEGPAATVRQMFVDGPVNGDGMDPNPGGKPKRHFRKIWTTRTSAELFQKDIETLSKVTSIVTTVEDTLDLIPS